MPDPTPTPIMPLLNLYGWGGNYYGQFGNNTTVDLNVPTKLSEDTTWKFVFAGVGTSHGIKNDGTLWGWGRNTSGQVGNGQGGIYAQNLKVPVQIGSDNDWKLVSPGTQFTLAIKNNGTLWGWGLTEFGGAGNNYSPTQIGTDSDWKSVHGGYLGAHAIKNNGTLWGWGNNTWGTIGDGTFYLNGSIVRVTQVQIGSDIWKNISTGPNSDHKLAIKNDDTLWTWGGNSNGQLGDGNKTVPGPGGNFNKPYPIKVDNSSWISIATGIGHSLAVRSDGTLWSCGRNDYGQLGNGTTNESLHFIQIGSDSDWSSVYACAYTSFAMKSDGTFWSWGKNVFGETGDGTLPDVLPNPTRFAQIGSQFLQVYSGVFHCLALKEVVEPATTPTPTSTPTPAPTETPQPTPTATSCCGQDDKDWWTRCDSLILNGNFDYRVGNSGTFADTSDWVVQNAVFVGPPHGSNYIGSIYVGLNNQNTCTPGYIQQSFLTTIGQQYKLYFNMAASLDQLNFPEPQELKTFTVSVAGVTKDYVVDTSWQQSNTYQGMGWVSESLEFTAVDTTTVLRFESTYNGCFGPAVDRIEVCESNCLLSNGDFSLPSSPSGSCVGASGNDNRQGLLAAPPWYVFENCNVQSFYYCDNSKPYNRYVAMEIAQNGCFIEQIINTTPGQRYVCTFDMGASPGANILYQGQRAIEACVYDAAGYTSNTGLDPSQPIFQEIFLIDDVTTGNTYESLGWESKFFEFNATANTTLIRFRSPKHGTEVIHEAYSVIDNISVCQENSVTPTPTPNPTPTPTEGCSGELFEVQSSFIGLGGIGNLSLVSKGSGFSKLSAGENHSHFLAIDKDKNLYAWGGHDFGQLGDGTTTPMYPSPGTRLGYDSGPPIKVGEDYICVSGGYFSSFGIKTNGDLYAWGKNMINLPGLPAIGQPILTPTKVGEGYKYVNLGERSGAAIKDNGDLYIWGSRFNFENKEIEYIDVPTKVGENYVEVQAPADEGWLALKNNGDLYAWGSGGQFSIVGENSVTGGFPSFVGEFVGGFGDGTIKGKTLPTKIGEGYKSLVKGHGSLAIKENGDLYVWKSSYGFIYPTKIGEEYSIVSGIEFTGGVGGGGWFGLKTNGDLHYFPFIGTSSPNISYIRNLASSTKMGEGYSDLSSSDHAWFLIKSEGTCVTPTPTPTKECNICFRMACDNVCPQATPTPTPTPTPYIFWPVEIHSPHISDYFSIPTNEEFWSNSLINNNDDNSIYQIRKVSFDENNNKMYVASNTNLIFTIDLANNTILNKFNIETNNVVGIEVNTNGDNYYVLGSHLVSVNPIDNTKNILTYVGVGLDIKYEPINNRIYYLSKTDSNFTKLGYWSLNDNTDVVLETFEFSNGSIDAYVHKVCVSLTDLNKIAIVDLLSSNTEYVDITQPKGLTINNSGNIFLLSLNNIINIDNTNIISNIWQNEGLNNPTFIKGNINKNKIYIANKNNTITLHDSTTGFYIMTSSMPTINGEFTDFKITNSGTLYGVYNNRVVIFDKSAIP